MNKTTRNRIIAIFFGLLMLGSTATYAILQAYNFFGTGARQQSTLPSSYIVNGKLSDTQEQLIEQNQGTVVQFYYSGDCLECLQQRSTLESVVSQNNGQIYLEEIQTQSTPAQNIIMKSYKDSKFLTNASLNDIQNAFCDVLLYPPADCALRNLNTS